MKLIQILAAALLDFLLKLSLSPVVSEDCMDGWFKSILFFNLLVALYYPIVCFLVWNWLDGEIVIN